MFITLMKYPFIINMNMIVMSIQCLQGLRNTTCLTFHQELWFLDLPQLHGQCLGQAVAPVRLRLLAGPLVPGLAAQHTQQRPSEARLGCQVNDQVHWGVHDGKQVTRDLLKQQWPDRGPAGGDPLKLETLEHAEGEPGGVTHEEHGGHQQKDHRGLPVLLEAAQPGDLSEDFEVEDQEADEWEQAE